VAFGGKWIVALGRYRAVSVEVLPLDFADFYQKSRHQVFRAVLLATRQPDRAEDAVADAYAAAFARWPSLGRHPNPTAWVVRTALNRFRSGWRIWRREGPEAPDVQSVVPPSEGLDADLLAALWRLPARQREVVGLRVLADLDTAQAAAVLGISPSTVAVHLHRALQALRASLEASGYKEMVQ
jgi:RNA polymerase sigma factor (sigma-70 family)